MKARRHLFLGALLVLAAARLAPPARSIVPDSLTNERFWELSTELSEPGGTFRSDNLLSNERQMQQVIPALTRAIKPGAAYVLPEWQEGKTHKSLKALGLDTSKPGKYTITGIYSQVAGTAKWNGAEHTMWGGTIATNTIEVEVAER